MTQFNPSEHLSAARQGGPKDYLQVKWRLVWFRDEWPHGIIESQHVEISDTHAIFRATVTKVDADGTIKGSATDYGSETQKDFRDFVEKASTKAIGRALAALGYGTQFAPELDEGERIVDSPVSPPKAPQNANKPSAKRPVTEAAMKRIHALLADNGLEHKHLHAYAVANDFGSVDNMSMDDVTKVAEGLKNNTDASVKYLTKLFNDQELAEENAKLNAKIDGGK